MLRLARDTEVIGREGVGWGGEGHRGDWQGGGGVGWGGTPR